MTGMWTMISRLGCCRTRHRPGSSFSFSAAMLKRAACDSQGFFSCSSVSEVSIKLSEDRGAWVPWHSEHPREAESRRQGGKPYEYMQAAETAQGKRTNVKRPDA